MVGVSFIILCFVFMAFFIYGLFRLVQDSSVFGFLLFIFIYLSVYLTFQILLYEFYGDGIALFLSKTFKELSILIIFVLWALTRKDIFGLRLQWTLTDYLMLFFLVVPLVFTILPIGSSSLINKALYFRGILMLVIIYFLGRVVRLNVSEIRLLFHTLLALAIGAFLVIIFERLTYTHYQTIIPYESFHREVMDMKSTGNYGLTWTFEAGIGVKRFAAFFANPLEMASAMVLCGSVAIYLWFTESNLVLKTAYCLIFVCISVALMISFSRASFFAFFLMIGFGAYLKGYWKLILMTITIVFIFSLLFFTFGQKDFQYYLIDTITFSESSSLGHVIEWVKAIDSMVQNPFGIGLATSGNAGGVDPELQVGGENQFLIFGVQMGLPYMILYIVLLISSIVISTKAYKHSSDRYHQGIAFVASVFKFAFLLPLMTSNAEIYLFVAYLSWFMVGQSVTIYQSNKDLAPICP